MTRRVPRGQPSDVKDVPLDEARPSLAGHSGTQVPDDAYALLGPALTPERRARMEAVAAARTRHIRLVVQDVHDPHNIAACLRSADAFGVQHIEVVLLRERFKASGAARGVGHWLSLRRHRDVAACVAQLRADGFRLCAGVPSKQATPLFELPVTQPLAVVFGNEHDGIDEAWLPHIDQTFTIPMVGMVESLNISVSAAITLSHLTHAARAQLPASRYHFDSDAQRRLLDLWVCRQMPGHKDMLAKLRARDQQRL